MDKMKTLTELSAEYYALVNRDHHKDGDCHFYIQKIYSYGDEPYWQYQFLHYGYCWSVEKFFEDDENIKKYQEYFNHRKDGFKNLKTNPIIDNDGEKHYLASGDFDLREFPQRQTEQEAEQDMRNFLEWAIEKEKEIKARIGDE